MVEVDLLDADPKGSIEEQTRKLFDVCRLRDLPVITATRSTRLS
jgi:peptide subunit release factor RF-3